MADELPANAPDYHLTITARTTTPDEEVWRVRSGEEHVFSCELRKR